MKAIHEIISYLRFRGMLSGEQLVYLQDQGFLPRLQGYDDTDEYPPDAQEDAAEERDLLQAEERVARSRGKSRRPHREGASPRVLAARLRERAASWDPQLEGLVRLGRRLGPCSGWQEAAVLVRQARDDRLLAALCTGLEAREPTLRVLWEALSLEEHHEIASDPHLRGPARNAYRTLLKAPAQARDARYARLCRYQEVNDACNLQAAQNRLFRTVARALSSQPEVLAASFRRDFSPVAYWALVVLYSARCSTPGDRRLAAPGEHFPRRRPPPGTLLRQAWLHAALMDPAAAAPFLAEYGQRLDKRRCAVQTALVRKFNDLGYEVNRILFLYYLEERAPERIAALYGYPLGSVLRWVLLGREWLRQAVLDCEALSLSPEAPHASLDRYVDDWLHSALVGAGPPPIEEYEFASEGELICPESWD